MAKILPEHYIGQLSFDFGTGQSDNPVAMLAIGDAWNRITVGILFFGFIQSDILAEVVQLTLHVL